MVLAMVDDTIEQAADQLSAVGGFATARSTLEFAAEAERRLLCRAVLLESLGEPTTRRSFAEA